MSWDWLVKHYARISMTAAGLPFDENAPPPPPPPPPPHETWSGWRAWADEQPPPPPPPPPPRPREDWHEVLGLPPGTTDVTRVRSRYRELAKLHHPDVGGNTRTMAKVNEAYAQALAELGAPE